MSSASDDWSTAVVVVAGIGAVTFLLFTGKCTVPDNDDIKCVKAGGTYVRAPGCASDYCQSKEKR